MNYIKLCRRDDTVRDCSWSNETGQLRLPGREYQVVEPHLLSSVLQCL